MSEVLSPQLFDLEVRTLASTTASSRAQAEARIRSSHEALRAQLESARDDARQEALWRAQLGNAVLENASDAFDDDVDQDMIAIRYVRWLEGSDGAQRIARERLEQLRRYDHDHDAEHASSEIPFAAIAYSIAAVDQVNGAVCVDPEEDPQAPGRWWPWEPESFKPSDDPIRNLEKAGALIAAEIDRLLAAREAAR